MKKLFYLFIAIGMMIVCSCDEDVLIEDDYTTVKTVPVKPAVELSQGFVYIDVPENTEYVMGYNYADSAEFGPMKVVDGKVAIKSNAPATVMLYAMSKTRATAGEYIGTFLIPTSDSDINIDNASEKLHTDNAEFFLSLLPAGEDNIGRYESADPSSVEDYATDMMFKSNGLSFSIYPVYSLGWYDLQLGIFYFDADGTRHETTFWGMQENNWGKTSYEDIIANNSRTRAGGFGPGQNQNPGQNQGQSINYNNTSTYEIIKSDADGFTITLPKGTLYGFFIYSDPATQGGKFYTAKMFNSDKVHAAAFTKNGMNYIGFEDQNGGDNDLNDLICYVTPQQEIIENPTQETIDAAKKQIVEPVPVPEFSEKIVHLGHNMNGRDIDVEARLQKEPYPYIRINVPCHGDDDLTVDYSMFEDLIAEEDDVRIAVKEDITSTDIPYIRNGKSINVKCPDNINNGEYQLKIELRPIEDKFSNIEDYLKKMDDESYDWTKICKFNK